MTVNIEVKEETAVKLQALAAALNVSLEEYLEKIAALFPVLPTNGEALAYSGPTPYELVKDLIGSVDSSLPEDPNSPPHRPPMYYLVAEKLRKQGLNIP